MKPFDEEDRYVYDLTPASVVLDCGGHKGDFAAKIHERYGCTVHVLEPVRQYYEACCERLGASGRIFIHPWGVGLVTESAPFKIKGDMTGLFAESDEQELVLVKTMADIFSALGLDRVDLLKLNIEGGEFTAVEQLIATGLIERVRNLQVQWHPVVTLCEPRYGHLQQVLASTHQLTFDAGWTWQNWRLK